jgi:DNA repair protein SbcD/Mre11
MRFIHTADWHLGRLFHGVHLTQDQAQVLGQLVELAREARPDVILVAGDIYDRAVPPPDAVELLDDVLSRLLIDLEIPVVLIAGNHDSPGRLNFASRLLAGRRLYVTGNLPAKCEPLRMGDADGMVEIFGVPYAEPAVVRACIGCEDAVDHNGATKAYLDRIRGEHKGGGRRVLVGHAFVAGGAACESERPLSVGGAGTVDAACFHGFDYVALGHLHAPQSLSCGGGGDERTIHYCGSLLKYSFDEADQKKAVYVVEMDGRGRCRQEAVALKPRHDVRRISGTFEELLKGPADGVAKDDYLEVMLLDEGQVVDAIGRLREVYPNVMSIRRPESTGAGSEDRPNVRTSSDIDLFKRFFQNVTGGELTAPQQAAFVATVDALAAAEREVDLEDIGADVAAVGEGVGK